MKRSLVEDRQACVGSAGPRAYAHIHMHMPCDQARNEKLVITRFKLVSGASVSHARTTEVGFDTYCHIKLLTGFTSAMYHARVEVL